MKLFKQALLMSVSYPVLTLIRLQYRTVTAILANFCEAPA